MSGSKFGKLLKSREEDKAREEGAALEPGVQGAQTPTFLPETPEPAKRPVGRPSGGKRSNPDYERITAYLPRDLVRRLKIRALERGDDLDFSELLEKVLETDLERTPR